MWSVEKRSWEFDFAANSNAYTGYTAIINSTAVLGYWGISGIKMGNRQGETRWIESPMFHSYVSFPRLSPVSLSPIALSSMSLAYLAPFTLPWLSSLCLSSKRDMREMRERDTGERGGGDEGERQRKKTGEEDEEERRRRETRERGKEERQGERDSEEGHRETPYPHFLAPPHTFNFSITVLPQIHLNVEVLLVYL